MADINLPEIMDPLLDYLAAKLPPPAYTAVATLLEQSYALVSSLCGLIGTLVTSGFSSWDVEKILPPIITLLAAYLALVSFYRTTGWMIRMAFGFVKWGFILTTLGGMAGYILANANEGNGLAAFGSGLLPSLGGMLLEMLNGQGANTNGGRKASSNSRSSPGQQQKQKPKQRQARPKAHESWDRHREWQYSEKKSTEQQSADVQKVIADIVGNAGKFVRESGWLNAAKDTVEKVAKGFGMEDKHSQGDSGAHSEESKRKPR